jgi:hypothetical protein
VHAAPEFVRDNNFDSQSAPPEVWVKVGIDGTNLWRAAIESVTLSFAEPGLNTSPDFVHSVAVAVGHESSTLLAHLFAQEDLRVKPVFDVRSPCKGLVRVRLFICADHQARCKLAQCDGATSTLDGRFKCPYCDATPDEVSQFLQEARKCYAVRAGDRRFHLPIWQSPPDLLHGCQVHLQHAWDQPIEATRDTCL